MKFLIQNGGTILVCVLLTLAVIYNVRKLCKEKSICGCGCKDCPSNGACHGGDR